MKEGTTIKKYVPARKVNQYSCSQCEKELARLAETGERQSRYARDVRRQKAICRPRKDGVA